jgi:hypothetical protein
VQRYPISPAAGDTTEDAKAPLTTVVAVPQSRLPRTEPAFFDGPASPTSRKGRSYRSSRCQFGLPLATARRMARRARRRAHAKRKWRIIVTKSRAPALTSHRDSMGRCADCHPTSIQHPRPFRAIRSRPRRRPQLSDQPLPSTRVRRSSPLDDLFFPKLRTRVRFSSPALTRSPRSAHTTLPPWPVGCSVHQPS